MKSFAPRLMVLLLCGSALAGCASTAPDAAGVTGAKAATASPTKDKLAALANTPGDLESSVRQAQLARLSGQYDQAVHILSQMMLVAADDPRVVGEYGKTLVEQGRASEAVQFLNRASELSPNDWTLYSAIGVADDQLGDQPGARKAYEHALALKPGEPSILNNYALSRMLANDPEAAHALIARARIAGGGSDPKIARNIAMLEKLAPAPQNSSALAYAVQKPAPAMMASSAQPLVAASAPVAAPHPLVSQQNLPGLNATKAPTPLAASSDGVVMQRVPVDPLAGPVKPAAHASHTVAKAEPVKPAKPDDKSVASAKPDLKPAPAKTEVKPAPVKTASAKPDLKPAPAKAEAKPAPAKAKDAVPALRMTADASTP